MRASLARQGSTVWIARPFAGAFVAPYDVDGRALAGSFHVPSENGVRARIEGLAVDRDLRVWIADSGAERVRAFTLFGRELAGFSRASEDRAGAAGTPIDVAVDGVELDCRVLVASSGERRHALQVFRADGELVASIRPRGEPNEPFRNLSRASLHGRTIWTLERASGLVHVYRDGDFHFLFRPPGGAGAEARAVRPLDDGRLVIAVAGERNSGLWSCDASGRPLRRIAQCGLDEGCVHEPDDLVVLAEDSDRRTRIAVVDMAGERVQVFNLEGDCYGTFEGLSGAAEDRAHAIESDRKP